MKKLEIGKTEIVICPEKGNTYLSIEERNGFKDQRFNSSNLPNELKAVYIGEEIIDGKKYEKYTLKTIPKELQYIYLRGKKGFFNQNRELNSAVRILRGKAEDGRKIAYVRSMNIKDVNEILGVIVDIDKKKVYQKGRENININLFSDFGKKFNIYDNFKVRQIKIIQEYIKGEYIKSTEYHYYIENLKTEKYLKKLICLEASYYLTSPGVVAIPGHGISFSLGAVSLGMVLCGGYSLWGDYEMFGSRSYTHRLGVRPVFYLESNKQSKIAKYFKRLK